MALYVSQFIALLFNITDERTQQIRNIRNDNALVFGFRDGVINKALKKYKKTSIDDLNLTAIIKYCWGT